MLAPEVYIGAKKELLLATLENAIRAIRKQPEGSVSFSIYANPTDGTVTFTDEDTSHDEPEVLTIEVEG